MSQPGRTQSSAPTVTSQSPGATSSPNPTPAGGVTESQLVAVAEAAISPAGAVCDTLHPAQGPATVDGCPYTERLKHLIDAKYQAAAEMRWNPNPVLSADPPCDNGRMEVSYYPTVTASGGVVALTTCGAPVHASYQKLVIVRQGSELVVDDLLLDARHTGTFVSVYYEPAPVPPVAAVSWCSVALYDDADGNVTPLFCSGGSINSLAWQYYSVISTSVMGLGYDQSAAQVEAAMCRDINRLHATQPIEDSGERLAAVYYGWNLGAAAPNPYLINCS